MQYTAEKSNDTLEIRVYSGASGEFSLYEDEGDNYNYESGKYTVINFKWNEKKETLIIENMQGSYINFLKKRVFNIVFVSEGNGVGIELTANKVELAYDGKRIVINKMK